MPLTLRVPALGESVQEATLGAWKHAEGDEVSADEPLVEVESEKATLEVPSPGAGVLRKILRKTGETVAVGDAIAEIEPLDIVKPASPAPAAAKSANGGGAVRAAPSARRAMAESGLAPEEVAGSGRGGRISKQDVDRTLEQRPHAIPSAPAARAPVSPVNIDGESIPRPLGIELPISVQERVVPMSPLRKTVA